jgi:hypothetical protein
MTRAETISLALDAGFNPITSEEMDIFVAFAALVASAEREACANVAEQVGQHKNQHGIAAAIRARQ